MEKSNQVIRPYQPSFQVVRDVYSQIREMVESQMRGAALALVQGLFAEEIAGLCGPVHSRKGQTLCHRGGSDRGSVVIQGQRVAVKKLRAKRDGEDVELESYRALQSFDLLCERVMKHMLSGVSTRDYSGLLDELEGGLGLSKSSVSRAFQRGSQVSLDEINGRDLSRYRFVSVLLDGIAFGDRMVIAAVGIAKSHDGNPKAMGDKVVLGLREGDTEEAEVVKDLLQSLIERGLDSSTPYLFVIDGSKALRKGIRKVFGDSPVQRCTRHKERNILKYLSHRDHMEFRRRWKRLHGIAEYEEAKREHESLRQWLGQRNQQALASLDESEMETLTVIRLRLPAILRKTLLSTNPLESMFSIVDIKKGRVKNWKTGERTHQVSRWAAATLIEAEKRVRKIRGYRELVMLETELTKNGVEKESQVA